MQPAIALYSSLTCGVRRFCCSHHRDGAVAAAHSTAKTGTAVHSTIVSLVHAIDDHGEPVAGGVLGRSIPIRTWAV